MPFTTSKTLLKRIKEGDEVSWNEFYHTYELLIWMHGKDYGLKTHELKELVQDIMIAFFKSRKTFQYSPEKGSFRTYLKTAIRHQSVHILKKRKAPQCCMESEIDNMGINIPCELERSWNIEWNEHKLMEGMNILKLRMELLSYQAFCLYAIDGIAPGEVAKILGISQNAVYIAKSRGIGILRKEIEQD